MINTQQARVIDRLRNAAKEHGEVADLLAVLAECFPLLSIGNVTFLGSEESRSYLATAIAAASFSALDNPLKDKE